MLVSIFGRPTPVELGANAYKTGGFCVWAFRGASGSAPKSGVLPIAPCPTIEETSGIIAYGRPALRNWAGLGLAQPPVPR